MKILKFFLPGGHQDDQEAIRTTNLTTKNYQRRRGNHDNRQNDLNNPGGSYREISRVRSPRNRDPAPRDESPDQEVQARIEEITTQIDELRRERHYLNELTPRRRERYNYQFKTMPARNW